MWWEYCGDWCAWMLKSKHSWMYLSSFLDSWKKLTCWDKDNISFSYRVEHFLVCWNYSTIATYTQVIQIWLNLDVDSERIWTKSEFGLGWFNWQFIWDQIDLSSFIFHKIFSLRRFFIQVKKWEIHLEKCNFIVRIVREWSHLIVVYYFECTCDLIWNRLYN